MVGTLSELVRHLRSKLALRSASPSLLVRRCCRGHTRQTPCCLRALSVRLPDFRCPLREQRTQGAGFTHTYRARAFARYAVFLSTRALRACVVFVFTHALVAQGVSFSIGEILKARNLTRSVQCESGKGEVDHKRWPRLLTWRVLIKK